MNIYFLCIFLDYFSKYFSLKLKLFRHNSHYNKNLRRNSPKNWQKSGIHFTKISFLKWICLYRLCLLLGKMVPYQKVTYKRLWKNCQLKCWTSKVTIWLHQAGEQSGTGTLSSLVTIFCSLYDSLCIFCAKNQKLEG